MRSRGINTAIIFQSIAQLKSRYPNDVWQNILGNCDSKLCMGCNEIMTAEYVSNLLGVATVETNSIRKDNGFEGNFEFGNINIGVSKRNLINPDELIKMDSNKLIIILRGKKPLIAYKYDYSDHPLSKEMEEIVIEEYKEKLNVQNIIQEVLNNKKVEKKKIEELPTFEEFLKERGKEM